MNDWRELSYPLMLGDYLQQQTPEGDCIILRGKYKGCYLNTVPKGYVRSFILKKWELTPPEQILFETRAKRTEAEEIEHQEKEERKRLRMLARLAKKGLAYGNPTD